MVKIKKLKVVIDICPKPGIINVGNGFIPNI